MPATLLVNLQMHCFFTVQLWIYPQESVSMNHTLVVNYVDMKARITFPSATSLCIALSIDLEIKTLLVLLLSVAHLQFHVLPRSPNVTVSSAAPGWPLRAFALWLHWACDNTQLRWQSSWDNSTLVFWVFLIEIQFFFLNGSATSCFQRSFFMSESTQFTSLCYFCTFALPETLKCFFTP